MESVFPLGFEADLAFYLTVHVLALAVHAFLMTYVLAGSLWVAWAALFPGSEFVPRSQQPLAMILRDWMPFVLSGAITAGVAPLLFVQILYRKQFYTANLLLGPRWMIVIPVLVLAFYLLYVVKSRKVAMWSRTVRGLLSVCVAACFLFVAFCWTTNSLLMTSESAWPEIYRTGDVVDSNVVLAVRLMIWVTGAFPVMSVLASWQLWGMRRRMIGTSSEQSEQTVHYDREERRLAAASIAGACGAVVSAGAYASSLDPVIHKNLLGAAGAMWLVLTGAGIAVLVTVCARQLRLKRPTTMVGRILITFAIAVSLIGTASLREIIRLSQLNLGQVTSAARDAGNVGGFGVFVVCLLVTSALMAWCIRLVRQSRNESNAEAGE